MEDVSLFYLDPTHKIGWNREFLEVPPFIIFDEKHYMTPLIYCIGNLFSGKPFLDICGTLNTEVETLLDCDYRF